MIQPEQTPQCKIPSNIACVDDEKTFLQELFVAVEIQDVHYRFQLDSGEAVKIINERTQGPIKPAREIHNPRRFDRVSVVVTDFQMKGVDGLQLCARIDPSICKIIVSKRLPTDKAMQAFNRGEIQGFLHKDQKDRDESLRQLIRQGLNGHFCRSTGTFREAGEQAQSALKDAVFCTFFHKICKEREKVEHYLIRPKGDLMVAGPHGQVGGIIVRSRAQLREEAKRAQQLGAPAYVVHGLQNADCLLCPGNPEELELTEQTPWETSLYPITKLLRQGDCPYYVSCCDGVFDAQHSNMLTFFQYEHKTP
ncbi:MAG: hypothetical protein AAF471_06920 [Myxococcota bacterium]